MKKNMKKRILIDIDVVCVAKHYVKDKDHSIAKHFIDRTESGEFEISTPYTLLEIVSGWKDIAIKKKILDFYHLLSRDILSVEKVASKFNELRIKIESICETKGMI